MVQLWETRIEIGRKARDGGERVGRALVRRRGAEAQGEGGSTERKGERVGKSLV